MSVRRVAVVTEGSAGIGRAVVREFATHGWDVGVLARREAGLDAALGEVEQAHCMVDATADARNPWWWASMHRAALGGAAVAAIAEVAAVQGRRA